MRQAKLGREWAVVVLVLAAGCKFVGGEYRPTLQYRFSAVAPARRAEARPQVLAFGRFMVQGPYGTRMVYLKGDNQVVRDDYNRWIMAPESLIAKELYQAIAQANVFAQVLPSAERGADWQVTGTLLALEVTPALQAQLSLHLQVIETQSGKVALAKVYQQQVALANAQPVQFAAAVGSGLSLIAAEFASDLEERLPD